MTDDLRIKPWKGNSNLLVGQCYVAGETFFHLCGGKKAGWKPMNVRHENSSHWYLKHNDGMIVDITAKQFNTAVPYHLGRGRGFLTKKPSARAKKLIERINYE